MNEVESRTPGTLSPFGYRAFLALWTASLVFNLGNAVQGVGAAWLMTTLTDAADMISLVQSAVALPIMLFALVAGAVADLFDRRRVMLVAQCLMLATSVLLAALTSWGMITPWLLLALTFLLGTGAAFSAPGVQASIGDIVPRRELAGAVSLNALGFNIARSVGPALGGGVVAFGGAGAAFIANAGLFVGSMVLIALWRAPDMQPRQHAGIGPAIAEGLAYVIHSPAMRTVLIRAITFTMFGSAAWGLMPLVTRDLVGGGPDEFGWLLGGLGFGAVVGAFASTRIRTLFSNETIIRAAGLIYGSACLLIALQPGFVITFLLLVMGGTGWVQALTGFNVTGQIWSPRRVVGRAAATVNSVIFGGIALGSWAWGHFTESWGIAAAMAASGLAMILLPLLGLLLRLPENAGPELEAHLARDGGR